MVPEDERYLEDPEEWDFDSAEKRTPSKPARAVVSVSMPREEYEHISAAAERLHMKTSAFIRSAAVSAARGIEAQVLQVSGGALGASFQTSVISSGQTQGPRHPEVQMGDPVAA
jgi:hypothetical protein